jgi:O-antigen/teichoic acid export membrane protein
VSSTFEPVPTARRLLTGSAWAVGGRITGSALGLGSSVLIARVVTPLEAGLYFLSISVLTLATSLAQLGMPLTAMRLIPEATESGESEKVDDVIASTLAVATAGGIVIGLVFVAGAWRWLSDEVFHFEGMSSLGALAALWVLLFSVQSQLVGVFRGLHKQRIAAVLDLTLSNLLFCLLLLGMWLNRFRPSLSVLLAAMNAGMALTVGVAALSLGGRIRSRAGPTARTISQALAIGPALMLTGIILTVLVGSVTDMWVLGAFGSGEGLAYYGADVRLVTVVYMPFIAVLGAVAPMLAEMNAGDLKVEMESIARTVTAAATAWAALICVLFIAAGGWLLSSLFGAAYGEGKWILLILALAQLANIFTGPWAITLAMTGHQRHLLAIVGLAGLASVGGDIAAARYFGPIGVAVASSAALCTMALAGLLLTKRWTGIWTSAKLSNRDARNAILAIGAWRQRLKAERNS